MHRHPAFAEAPALSGSVAGEVFDDAHRRVEAVSLVERFGRDRALSDPLGCITEVVAERLTR